MCIYIGVCVSKIYIYVCVCVCVCFWVYGISTFLDYLMLNPFLSTQFNHQNYFYFKLFSFVKQF